MYFFTDDLAEYLLKYGISEEHINEMKSKLLEQDRDVYQIFPSLDSSERDYIDLVPLEKVIGTSRGTPGWSVFENVRKMNRGDREPYRFENCLSFLEKMSLEELRKSYEKLSSPVTMVYYVDDDNLLLLMEIIEPHRNASGSKIYPCKGNKWTLRCHKKEKISL